MRSLLAALVFALCGCSSSSGLRADASSSDPRVARDQAYSYTYEILFGTDEAVAGYLVEFYRTPLGVLDERRFPAGTVLLQDEDFRTIAFITPASRAFALGPSGESLDLGFGGRDTHVKRIFGHSERPRYQSIQPGVPAPGK